MNRPGGLLVVLLAAAVLLLANEHVQALREWWKDRRFQRARRRDLDRGQLPDTWHPRNAARLRDRLRNEEPPPRRSP